MPCGRGASGALDPNTRGGVCDCQGCPMDFDYLAKLVSGARLQAYLDEVGGSKPLAAELYLWDAELAAALWELISAFEIAMRNAMARELTTLRRSSAPRAAWFNCHP